jgi:hypothetical protein
MELLFSFSRVLVCARVGPLAQGGLDEAFGLAVGARRVRASKSLFHIELSDGLPIEQVPVARSVVAVDAAHIEAEAVEVLARHEEEADG